jgi:peptidyl-prolyl cis-trans isomerase SurA
VIKIKKIIFFIIKSTLAIVALLTLVLFFYAAFFYDPSSVEKETAENQIIKSEESSDVEEEKRLKEEEKQRLEESRAEEKISKSEAKKTSNVKIVETTIEDGLFATVGNKAITKSDVLNEIKLILILNNKIFSEEERKKLQQIAVKSIIKRYVKQIEIERNNFLEFNQQDVKKEILRLANNINVDVETLKKICASNQLDFSIIEDQIKIELLWNSLIFQLYKDRLSVNLDEIDEQLKLIQNKKEIEEYLISEIVIKTVEKDKLESVIRELKNKIKIEGFESVAISLSISDSASRGGNLGWIKENLISKKLLSIIANTPPGNISEPILLPRGILIFKVRNKRKIEKNINIEETKNELVNSEKTKILNMHSSAHYNNIRSSVSVKFF